MQTQWMKQSISARLMIIGFLILVLLIPSFMIQSLIHERQNRRDTAILEVSQKWGQPQTLTGPLLSVPYVYFSKDKNNSVHSQIGYAHFLPENLKIDGELFPEIRKRGIYEVVLYGSSLKISGDFLPPNTEDLKVPASDFLWSDAFISIGVSDMKGLKDQVSFQLNDQKIFAQSGLETHDVISSGVSIPVDTINLDEKMVFSFDLELNGSQGLSFTPLGKESQVVIRSAWSNPSFMGAFLPSAHDIDDSGFEASWKILHLNRNFPQKWTGGNHDVSEASFGVDLLVPVDEYQKNMRTAKYAFMFIGLTFLSFFMIELLNKKMIHPIQYLLIGFSLLVFYTLLLSFSEHMVFQYAYLISSIAIITLITSYTRAVLKEMLQTGIILAILIFLYSYLYIVLQLQDFALLIGSIGLFVILSLVMYLTRRIDWFSTLQIPVKDKLDTET
ncbi:cell envelope integrity protein CreD [bacterium]|nr:cell envelope integrity protein CreD [bacterium]